MNEDGGGRWAAWSHINRWTMQQVGERQSQLCVGYSSYWTTSKLPEIIPFNYFSNFLYHLLCYSSIPRLRIIRIREFRFSFSCILPLKQKVWLLFFPFTANKEKTVSFCHHQGSLQPEYQLIEFFWSEKLCFSQYVDTAYITVIMGVTKFKFLSIFCCFFCNDNKSDDKGKWMAVTISYKAVLIVMKYNQSYKVQFILWPSINTK